MNSSNVGPSLGFVPSASALISKSATEIFEYFTELKQKWSEIMGVDEEMLGEESDSEESEMIGGEFRF